MIRTFSYEKTLLAVLEEQLGVVRRRIARSGVSYFAVTRFDAIVKIKESSFAELLSSAEFEPVLAPHAESFRIVESQIAAMIKEFPPLSADSPRSKRYHMRTGVLIEEIVAAAKARDPNFTDWESSDSEESLERSQFMEIWKSEDN